MSKKWFGMFLVSAIGAGMIANLAYQSLLMGEVAVGADARWVQQDGETIDVQAVSPLEETQEITVNGQGTAPRYRKTVRRANGGETITLEGIPDFETTAGGTEPAIAGTHTYGVTMIAPNAAMQEADGAVVKLLREYQAAEDGDREAVVAKIKAAVTKQFESRQEARSKELKNLEEQLAKLREKHAKRESMKDKIVSDRVEQLVDNVDGLGWGTDPVPSGASGWMSPGLLEQAWPARFGPASPLSTTRAGVLPALSLPAATPQPTVAPAAPTAPAGGR